MLKGYVRNKRLGTPALKVRSIKICRSLQQVTHDNCACSYFRRKSVQWHGIVQNMLGWREHYCNLDRETNKNITVKFLKKHTAYVNFASLFLFVVLNSSTQNIQFPKNQTHYTYRLCSGRKDKGCKNLAHTSKTRQVKHPKWLQLLGSRFEFLLLFQTATKPSRESMWNLNFPYAVLSLLK